MDIQTTYDRKALPLYDEIDILSVLEKDEFNFVYRPGDDSYLLLDALRFELDKMIDSKPLFALEIGCGSGFIINNLAKWFQDKKYNECCFMATDINYDAAYLTKRVSDFYSNGVDVLHTNILSGVTRIDKTFDVIICNPPYVPTEKEELEKYKEYLKLQNKTLKENPTNYKRSEKHNGIDASYAGGENGNEITVHILEKAKAILSENGTFYLLLIGDNNPIELVPEYFPTESFNNQCLLYKQYHNEKIYIYKIQRK